MAEPTTPKPRTWRSRTAQDLRVLRALFPWRVGGTLAVALATAAFIFQRAYLNAYSLPSGAFSYVKALYAVANMATFQVSYADLPPGPELDIFFVVVPLIGLPLLLALGANLLHVLRVLFVRQERGQLWQRALAGTVSSPVVVCGLGRVGYRVANELLDMGRPIVGLDKVTSPLIQALVDRGLPVILGDVRDQEVLVSAGVERSPTVICCTHDDLANIEAAIHVRELNDRARIVLRLFEDEIADDIGKQFQVAAILSRSAIAAQAFAYAALGVELLESFRVDDDAYALVELAVGPASPLIGVLLQRLTALEGTTAVCLQRHGDLIIEPPPAKALVEGDKLFLFTQADRITDLAELAGAEEDPAAEDKPVLVFGVGHTGYRVVRALTALGRRVVALDPAPGRLSGRLAESGNPVVYGDFRRGPVLVEAGIREAEALVVCTEDDMANLEVALRAREMAPGIRVVMRSFEQPLATQLQRAFDINAVYSTSALAAPAFVGAALNVHLARSVDLGESTYRIARLTMERDSRLLGESLGELSELAGVTVLLHRRGGEVLIPPDPSRTLEIDDEVMVLATPEMLREISLRNHGTRRLA